MAENKIAWKEQFTRKADVGERENFLKLLRGEQPDWVPNYLDAVEWVFTDFTYSYIHEDLVDPFGVKWVIDDAGEMADPDRKLLTDITKWRDFVRFPDMSSVDWEGIAKTDLAMHDPNKILSYSPCASGGTIFIPLMNMMGFENGLCALLEEPDACEELFDAFISIIEETMRHQIPLYKPDMLYFNDDLATIRGSFISMQTFEELFAPYYQRLINFGKEYGIPVVFHMCGKCQPFIERLHEMGINAWEVAQTVNDLKGMKEKYGNSLCMFGGWDSQGPSGLPGAPEELVRKSVHDAMDMLAPGGGYAFWDLCAVGTSADMTQKIEWLEDEARTYGRVFYQKNQKAVS